MMTIDIDTISGVPLSGELKTVRPMTSVQTRKPSRKMNTPAASSRARTIQAFMSRSTSSPRPNQRSGRPTMTAARFALYLIL